MVVIQQARGLAVLFFLSFWSAVAGADEYWLKCQLKDLQSEHVLAEAATPVLFQSQSIVADLHLSAGALSLRAKMGADLPDQGLIPFHMTIGEESGQCELTSGVYFRDASLAGTEIGTVACRDVIENRAVLGICWFQRLAR